MWASITTDIQVMRRGIGDIHVDQIVQAARVERVEKDINRAVEHILDLLERHAVHAQGLQRTVDQTSPP